MLRRIPLLLGGLALCLLVPVTAAAQQQPREPDVYTYVAQWGVARAQWAAATAQFDRLVRPVLERRVADGTLVGWGRFETVVHEENGMTHGNWWTATSIAGLERVREELIKLPPNPALAGASHSDLLLRSLISRGGATAPSSGYLWVAAFQVQPGKGQEWRDLWDRHVKPVFDELLASGAISSYSVDVEHVHTQNPGWRYIVYVAPNAEGVDKVRAGLVPFFQNRAVMDEFNSVLVPGAHWDYFARIPAMGQK